jgi:hypothetical protein
MKKPISERRPLGSKLVAARGESGPTIGSQSCRVALLKKQVFVNICDQTILHYGSRRLLALRIPFGQRFNHRQYLIAAVPETMQQHNP